MDKPNILLTLTRPMLDALEKSATEVLDKNCNTPFYSGVLVKSEQAESSKPETQTETGKTENKPTGKQQVQPESPTPPTDTE